VNLVSLLFLDAKTVFYDKINRFLKVSEAYIRSHRPEAVDLMACAKSVARLVWCMLFLLDGESRWCVSVF
jgi:hypothetical protein